MSNSFSRNPRAATDRTSKALSEAAGLLRGPHRIFPLLLKLTSDGLRRQFQRQHLYSYVNTTRPTTDALRSLIRWILNAQRQDGGIPAFYSLLSGYSPSYPEVTGYIIPTLYDFAHLTDDESAVHAAERATRWLLSLQMASGAFPSGLYTGEETPSVFNTGQILQGLVRAYAETKDAEILARAVAAGDWLTKIQQPDGSWSGPGAYQETAHTYYSMVSWALVPLSEIARDHRYAMAADKNIDWAIARAKSSGWIDGINLRGYPTFLHFIAYAIQGILECGILRQRSDVIQAASKPAWLLLRRFEITKCLLGTYEPDFSGGRNFTCVTGDAQVSCVWSRLFEATGDLRYLNAALKMNEMLKHLLQVRGRRGVAGGLAGSYPIWGAYQPLRYISWGCKFFADALMLEERLTRSVEASQCAS
jgi:hypothetical protein